MFLSIFILNLNCFLMHAYYNAKCPSGQLWYLRAQSICLSVEKYTCLFDSINNIYSESCSGPRSDPPGDKTVVNSGNFDTKPCSPDRLQPFPFSSSQGNDCIYRKSFCSEEGQVVYTNGTTKNDRKCRCDYTKSFHFISTSEKNICSCDPRKEDCSCVIKPCSEGEILSPDYKCIKKDIPHGKFVCREIDIHQTTERTLHEVQDSYTSKPITREKEVLITKIALIILTAIFIFVFIILFLMNGKPQKNEQLLNRDKNPIQASDKDFDHHSNFGSDETFKSAQETLYEMKSDISRSNTQNIKVGDGNENKKDHLKGIGLKCTIQKEISQCGAISENFTQLGGKMEEYLLHSHSSNTNSKYFYSFKQFISKEGGKSIPASQIHVALYLTHLLDKGSSKSVVQSAVYGIKLAHNIQGIQDPTTNSFVVNLMEAAKRQPHRPRVKKTTLP